MTPRWKVSVIIPVYGRADKLARAIRSVEAQVDVEVEIVVVDDHSRDPVAIDEELVQQEVIAFFRKTVVTDDPAIVLKDVDRIFGDVAGRHIRRARRPIEETGRIAPVR